MAEFYVSVPKGSMARQIATLINGYNKLHKRHTEYSVLASNVDYFVEIINDKVVGCAGVDKRYPTLSEIKHVCVAPSHRRQGVATKLIELAIANCETDYVYMSIRSDNVPSLMTAKTLNFVVVKRIPKRNYDLVIVGRKKHYGRSAVQ